MRPTNFNIKTGGVGIVFENIAFGHKTISAKPGIGEGKNPAAHR